MSEPITPPSRLRYLRRTMQRRACRHKWIYMTLPGSPAEELFCNHCQRTRWEDRA